MENCTKFGQLILSKIIKTVATSCQILRLKCTKFDFGWGSALGPAGGAHSAPPDSLTKFACFWGEGKDKGGIWRKGKGKEWEWKEGQGTAEKKNGGERKGERGRGIGKGCLLLNGGLVKPLGYSVSKVSLVWWGLAMISVIGCCRYLNGEECVNALVCMQWYLATDGLQLYTPKLYEQRHFLVTRCQQVLGNRTNETRMHRGDSKNHGCCVLCASCE